MSDIISIKNFLTNHTEKLIEIITNANFHHIHYNEGKNEIRMGNDQDGNPTAIVVNTSNLLVRDYVRDVRGDVIVLLQHKLNKSFIDTLKWLKSQMDGCKITKKVPLFNNFYSDYKKVDNSQNETIYDIKSKYAWQPNKRYWRDGISYQTQMDFGIGYDKSTNRIITPYYNESGECIGTIGRLNQDDVENEPKYLVMENFSRSNTLYGLWKNYKSIIEKNLVIVFESEKAVMQLCDMDYHVGVAVGGHSISTKQVEMLKSLNVRIIIAFDEGISEIEIKEQCEKFEKSIFNTVDIAYIYDPKHIYLEKGSKKSPSDLGVEVFKSMLKNCLRVYKFEEE